MHKCTDRRRLRFHKDAHKEPICRHRFRCMAGLMNSQRSALKGPSLSRSMNNDPPDIGTAPHLREVCRILTAISTRIRLSRTVPDQHPSVLPMPQAFNDTPVSNVLVDDADIDMIHYIAAPASNPPPIPITPPITTGHILHTPMTTTRRPSPVVMRQGAVLCSRSEVSNADFSRL